VLELGIGIATGYATLGRIGFEGRYDYGAIGNAIILASRLSGEAGPGEILIAQRTYAAAEDTIAAEFVGDRTLKGFSRPVQAYAVSGSGGGTPAAATDGAAPDDAAAPNDAAAPAGSASTESRSSETRA
jgi:class 3 adenylate cyclase